VETYKYISNNYKRLKCFDILDINTNRYGLWLNHKKFIFA
jgi:hypothetical protein